MNTFNSKKGARFATYAARCIENELLMHFRAIRKTANDVSISEPLDTDGDSNALTIMDVVSDEDTIIENIDRSIRAKKLYRAVASLKDPREKEIVILRYGLNGKEPLAQREIADKMNISRSYVSRIEKHALSLLKQKLDGEL